MVTNLGTEIEDISGDIRENENNLNKLTETSRELEERIAPLEVRLTFLRVLVVQFFFFRFCRNK